MAIFFEKLIKNLEKFFKPFPHLPTKFKEIFLPIIPWYLFVRGLVEAINGLRSLSASFQFGSLPKIFSRFLEINPMLLFWNGLIVLFIAFLYFSAFTNLAQKKTEYIGWQNWFQAIFFNTMVSFYQVVFKHESLYWSIFITFVGLFFLFEFQRFYKPKHRK